MFHKYYLLILLLLANRAAFSQCYVFVGSYNNVKSDNGVYVYTMDTTTGALTFRSAVRNVLNPAFVSIHPNGRYVYSVSDAKTPGAGSVSSYLFDVSSGSLKFMNSQPSGGENPVYVAVDATGEWLIGANYTGGSAAIFKLDVDGKIQPARQVFVYHDSSINKQRQDASHIHSAFFSPNNKWAFFPDLGADKIRVYSFRAGKKQPLQPAAIPNINTMPGGGPRHLAFHPNSRYWFCVNEMGGAIEVYSDFAKPRRIQYLLTHEPNSTATFGSADIHISPDGRFLYVSNRGTENNIAIFSIDANGMLQNVGYEPSGGDHPRNFTISPDGKFVLVANMNSGNIVVFKRNFETGLLQPTGFQIKVANPSCVVVRNYEH